MQVIVSKILSIAMLLVILVAIFDLDKFVVRELFPEPFAVFIITLIQVFGLFLNILIALELLDKITAHLN